MKILIGADVVPYTKETEALFVEGKTEELFGEVCGLIAKADRTVINLECALTTAEAGIAKYGPCLKANPKCADAFKKLGVTDVALSNNHVFDFGEQGLRDTMENLERVGLPYMGVGENDTDSRKPYIIQAEDKRIGFINVCEHEYSYALPNRMGANPYDPYDTMYDIRALKKETDFVVVLYHGGKEHCRYPSPRLRKLCREMAHNGANVVITQHSHCIGCYEEYEGAHLLYGQGNFHFCWSGRDESWYTNLLVELKIEEKIAINFIPLVSGERGIDVAKGEEAEEIMSSFASRNEELQNGKWLDGWRAFCDSVRENYENAIRGQELPETTKWKREHFAHYLDCEAHTDVWRELYKTWNETNK